MRTFFALLSIVILAACAAQEEPAMPEPMEDPMTDMDKPMGKM